jgi:hypothetical protein
LIGDRTLLSTSERNNSVVLAQLLNNSDDEMDTEDKESDGIEEKVGEGDGKKEEEAALESVAALLSAQADITVGEVADQNEFLMMHKLNVSIKSRLKITCYAFLEWLHAKPRFKTLDEWLLSRKCKLRGYKAQNKIWQGALKEHAAAPKVERTEV